MKLYKNFREYCILNIAKGHYLMEEIKYLANMLFIALNFILGLFDRFFDNKPAYLN